MFACSSGARHRSSNAYVELRREEDRRRLGSLEALARFGDGVRDRVGRLEGLVAEAADSGRSIATFGAAGRATILFNMVPALRRHVAYVLDESPERIGRLLPGAHNPVVALERLAADPPDVLLLSAWSYAPALIEKARALLEGRQSPDFWVPLPEPGRV